MIRDFSAPRSPAWLARARAWLAEPVDGPDPRLAATVLLLRDTARGPEVYVQRRAATMAFAASMYVFPGGGVDPADDEATVADAVLARIAADMGMPPASARPIVAAAVREVAEECAVDLDPATLSVRAHWVTPHFEPRRYDTWVLAARSPDGPGPSRVTTEADHARWVRPADLLAEVAAGDALMLPPTSVSLEQLAEHDTVDGYLAHRPVVITVLPELVDTGGALVMRADLP